MPMVLGSTPGSSIFLSCSFVISEFFERNGMIQRSLSRPGQVSLRTKLIGLVVIPLRFSLIIQMYLISVPRNKISCVWKEATYSELGHSQSHQLTAIQISTSQVPSSQINYKSLHYKSLHYKSLHYKSLHYKSLHYKSLHYKSLHTLLKVFTVHLVSSQHYWFWEGPRAFSNQRQPVACYLGNHETVT